jgi:cell division protein ZapE
VSVRAAGVLLDQVFGADMLSGGYRKKYRRAISRLVALARLDDTARLDHTARLEERHGA